MTPLFIHLRRTLRRSLKARVSLFTLVIFLAGIWALAFYTSRMLRDDMQSLLGDQQLSTVSFIATEVNEALTERMQALTLIAAAMDPVMLENPAALQKFLDRHILLHSLFNGGILALRTDGVAIADVPRSAERIGNNYMNLDSVAAALKLGQSTIGRPVIGKTLRAPLFPMAVPIRNAQGQVIGALAGATNLAKPNFLDQLTENHYGKTGNYLLVAPQHRLIVTSSDKSRIMESLPGAAMKPVSDPFIQGDEGSRIHLDALGQEVLASSRPVAIAGWYVQAQLPTEEAFAPIRALQQRMLVATLFLSVLSGALTWWMLKRQLSPMLSAVKTLASRSDTRQPPLPLPVTSEDEVGQLIAGFNRLLATLAQRETQLKLSETFKETILNSISAEIVVLARDGLILATNEAWRRFAMDNAAESGQVAAGTEVGANYLRVCEAASGSGSADAQEACDGIRRVLAGQSPSFRLEYDCHSPQQQRWFSMIVMPLGEAAQGGVVITHVNITERKQGENELRIAAAAFESQEAMMITDANSVILRVNKAFTAITGYSAEDAVGQRPRLLHSGHQNAAFYRTMWKTINRTGVWAGEIWDRRKDGEVYPKWLTISAVTGDDGSVVNYIGTQHDITERKKAEERIETLAFFDQLTGLPNRTLLLDRLNQAMTASGRSDHFGALLFIDLDNFKTLNDTRGHEVGDLLLKQVAQRLRLCLREGDTVARLGGDEFVVVLARLSVSEIESAADTEAVARKILATLGQSYHFGDATHHSTASMGATLFKGALISIDDLMKQADLTMYKSKAAGRNTVRFFESSMEVAVHQRAELEDDLRRALDAKQLFLHYQPQLDGERLTGAEVLVRWQHPRRGRVSPADFIPLAEETGLILPLGLQVLETACRQLALWATRPDRAHLTVAVNVSAHQFRQSNFVEQVLSVLGNTGANAQRLKLELTESLLVDNVQDIIEKMHALKARGVGFSLDDFGTGYSSLSYLKRLPLDQLKIDQSFVRDLLIDPHDAAIARTIVALAHSLGLGVIAEGVETEAQRDFLASAGCHAYQGYFFSRPLPIQEFEDYAQRLLNQTHAHPIP